MKILLEIEYIVNIIINKIKNFSLIEIICNFNLLNWKSDINNTNIIPNPRYEKPSCSPFFDVGIFPMQEFINEDGDPTELKKCRNWGQAEIQSAPLGKQLKSAWLQGVNMVHCDHFKYDTWD